MKTKLFRIINGGYELQLIATFEDPASYATARDTAIYFATREIDDFLIRSGKAEETYGSYRHNVCPGCGYSFRHNHVSDRKEHGTKRCDCGVLFRIDWEFPLVPTDRPIVDVDSRAWTVYTKTLERRGIILTDPTDIRRIQDVENWLSAHGSPAAERMATRSANRDLDPKDRRPNRSRSCRSGLRITSHT